MLTFLIRRVIYMIITLFFVSLVGFAIIEATPGSALDYKISQIESQGAEVSQGEINNLKAAYGLDVPCRSAT
jgi:peptide/nickel transport system permease protein